MSVDSDCEKPVIVSINDNTALVSSLGIKMCGLSQLFLASDQLSTNLLIFGFSFDFDYLECPPD